MEIAMVIWINDNPMTGGIIRLSDIRSPRREFNAYKQGDIVSAKCRGFAGDHSCVLARIGDSSTRGEFQNFLGQGFEEILKEFSEIIKKHTKDHVITECESNAAPANRTDTVEVEKSKVKGGRSVRQSVKKQKNSKLKRPLESSTQKNSNQSNLIRIANELELTELQEQTESMCKSLPLDQPSPSKHIQPPSVSKLPQISVVQQKETLAAQKQSPAKQQTISLQQQLTPAKLQQNLSAFRKVTPVKRNCVGSVVRGGLMALDQTVDMAQNEIPQQARGKECKCQEELDSLKKENESLKTSYFSLAAEVSSIWSWIHVLNQNQQQPQHGHQSSSFHQQRQHSFAESSQQNDSYTALLNSDEPCVASTPKTPKSATKVHSATSTANPSHAGIFCGFTKDQLKSDISGIPDFSKAAKKLFRRLYTEEEYRGRTLTGARPNKLFDSRPQLEDPSKLEVIYEIIKEKYNVGPVQVRDKIRELLKPCRLANKDCVPVPADKESTDSV